MRESEIVDIDVQVNAEERDALAQAVFMFLFPDGTVLTPQRQLTVLMAMAMVTGGIVAIMSCGVFHKEVLIRQVEDQLRSSAYPAIH